MGNRQDIIVLTEFIGAHKIANIQIQFNGKRYEAQNLSIEKAVNSNQDFLLYFLLIDSKLLYAITDHIVNNYSYLYPEIKIIITTDNMRKLYIEATLTHWQSKELIAIANRAKFLVDTTYELVTDPKIIKPFVKAKLSNDTGLKRFQQIILDKE